MERRFGFRTFQILIASLMISACGKFTTMNETGLNGRNGAGQSSPAVPAPGSSDSKPLPSGTPAQNPDSQLDDPPRSHQPLPQLPQAEPTPAQEPSVPADNQTPAEPQQPEPQKEPNPNPYSYDPLGNFQPGAGETEWPDQKKADPKPQPKPTSSPAPVKRPEPPAPPLDKLPNPAPKNHFRPAAGQKPLKPTVSPTPSPTPVPPTKPAPVATPTPKPTPNPTPTPSEKPKDSGSNSPAVKPSSNDIAESGMLTPTVYYFIFIDEDKKSCPGDKVDLHGAQGVVMMQVCRKTLDVCAEEGSCAVIQNQKARPLNVLNKIGGQDRFFEIEDSCRFGYGVSSSCLEPFYTLAADLNVYKPGDVIFIPSVVGLALPNGTKHNGFFIIRDKGRGIIGRGRFDFFSGYYSWRNPSNPFVKLGFADTSTHVPYYRVTGATAEKVRSLHAFPKLPSRVIDQKP